MFDVSDGLKKRKFFKFFLLVVLFFVSNDSLIFGTNADERFILFKYLCIALLTIGMLSYDLILQKHFDKRLFSYCLFLVFVTFFCVIMNQDFTRGTIYRICLILFAMCFVSRISIREFALIYSSFIFFVAVVSIVFFVLTFIYPTILTFANIVTNTADQMFFSYGGVYVSSISLAAGRNFGFCREPGVYQSLLILGLLFQSSGLVKWRICNVLVLLIAVLTTLSTTGYIAMSIWIFLSLFTNQLNKTEKIFLIFLVCGSLYILLFYTDLLSSSSVIFEKLNRNQYREGGSMVSRLASFFCNLRIFIEHPLCGVGLERMTTLFPLYSMEMFGVATKSNTNTILFLFASHGLIYGLLCSIPFFMFSKCVAFSRKTSVIVAFILFIICSGEMFIYSGWFYSIIFYGLSLMKCNVEL